MLVRKGFSMQVDDPPLEEKGWEKRIWMKVVRLEKYNLFEDLAYDTKMVK